MVCREKDANIAWTSASDGTLEERRYYRQNTTGGWRADVSAVLTAGGLMVEWVKYSSYGNPFGLPGGNTNSNGDCDAADVTQVGTWIAAPAYDVRGDVNLSGTLTSAETTILTNNHMGTTLGWNNLSAIGGVGNRKGYAGYEWESQTGGYHVRHRYLRPDLGRWIRRDPPGYVDGANLYEYVKSLPFSMLDSHGLAISHSLCHFTIAQCAASDPIIRALLLAMRTTACPMPSINCASCTDKYAAGFDCDTNAITICENKVPSRDPCYEVCTSMRHELVHAHDACLVPASCDRLACPKERACTEIRAYHLSGECCNPSARPIGQSYEDCVKAGAKRSVGTACAWSVEFAWQTCWNPLPSEHWVCDKHSIPRFPPPGAPLGPPVLPRVLGGGCIDCIEKT